MIILKTQKNKGLARKNVRSTLGGFTLVETLFAVYILTFTVVGLMTVISSSLFAARYAKDEVTANYLVQEVVDYIRNDRDTTVFLGSGSGSTGGAWDTFTTNYSACSSANYGCYFEVLNGTVPKSCDYTSDNKTTGCPILYYNDAADNSPFYTYDPGAGSNKNKPTIFKRKIVVEKNGDDELDVTVTVYWKNGGLQVSRSLATTLMNWQK